MENSNVQQAIIVLSYGTVFMLTVVSAVLIKLMLDISNLTKSLQSILAIIKLDLGPTIKEFKRALININSLANKTDNQFQDINNAISNTINAFSGGTHGFSTKAKFIISSLKKGVTAGVRVFFEEKKSK